MKEPVPYFTTLILEFEKSGASAESINKLFDLLYELRKKNRSHQEQYILAKTLHLLGSHHEAERILESDESPVRSHRKREKERSLKLLQEIRKENSSPFRTAKVYRDLREAASPKKISLLSLDDLKTLRYNNVHGNGNRTTYQIAFSDSVKNIIVCNKNVITEWINVFSENQPDEFLMMKLIFHFEWLAGIKKELTEFYRTADTGYKPEKTDPDWFNGLEVWDVMIDIDLENTIHTEILIADYYNNGYSLCLTVKDDSIIDLKYDPAL